MAYAEAEAEADPALLYGGHYGYGLGHYGYAGHAYGYGLGYGRTYAAYSGYPYAGAYRAGLWKRQAEAEPEADAALLYGGAYGYGLGHYGYAGHAYAPYAAYSG